jgi:FkbM family methyltransferase
MAFRILRFNTNYDVDALNTIFKNASLKNKLKIMICALYVFFPRRLAWKFKKIDSLMRSIIDRIIKGTIIRTSTTSFVIVDTEAFSIILGKGIWDQIITPVKDGVFLDVGAHIGKYSLPLARQFGKVLSIEAHPENFRALKEGIRLNGLSNITAINIAAWNSDKDIDLYLREGSGWYSVKTNGRMGAIKIRAKHLDGVLTNLRIERLDWIKVDVEGAELEVLEGMKRTLDRYKPKIVFENYGHSNKAVTFLNSNGYSTVALDNNDFLAIPLKTS